VGLKKCKQCDEVLIEKKQRNHSVWCSKTCRLRFDRTRRREDNLISGLPTATTGAIHELLVCTELLRNGFYVYRSVSANSPYDLIAIKEKLLLRIEVTTAYTILSGKIMVSKKLDRERFEILAAVVAGEIVYFSDSKDIPHKDLYSAIRSI